MRTLRPAPRNGSLRQSESTNRRWYPASDFVPCASLPDVPDRDRKALACWSGQSVSNRSPRPWQGRVLPTELCPQTTTLAANARVISPARPHARQRTPQLSRTSAHQPPALLQPSRIVRDRSSARLFRDGPDELPPGLFLLAETPRLAGYLDDLLQFVAHFLFPWLLPLLVGADGFEPPCLVRPDLQSGAFNRSATHPKTCLEKHKARSPVRSIRALWPSIFRSIGWSYPSPSGMLACLFQSLCSYPNGALIGQPAGDVPSTDDRARKDMAIACRLLVLPMVTRK